MPTLAYDADAHKLYITTYDDKTFQVEGEPDGDFFLATYDNEAVTASEGAKGDVQFSQRIASLGTVTSTSQWGSDTNKVLNQVFKDQQKGNHPKKVELKRITDTENVLVLTCSRAMIGKTPDYGIGVEAADRPWGFKLEKMKFDETQAPA
jgi:hypothetical protein